MYFGFVGAERFGDWHFEGEVVFEDWGFEEVVGCGKGLRHTKDFVQSSLLLSDSNQEWIVRS